MSVSVLTEVRDNVFIRLNNQIGLSRQDVATAGDPGVQPVFVDYPYAD